LFPILGCVEIYTTVSTSIISIVILFPNLGSRESYTPVGTAKHLTTFSTSNIIMSLLASINALFERCSTTIDPSDRRGTFDHFGKATFNIDLSMTNSNCYSATDNKPEGKRQIFSQKLLLDIANNSFQNDW